MADKGTYVGHFLDDEDWSYDMGQQQLIEVFTK